MGGLQAIHVLNQQPKAIKNLILNDVGAIVTTTGLKRIMGVVGKNNGVGGFFSLLLVSLGTHCECLTSS